MDFVPLHIPETPEAQVFEIAACVTGKNRLDPGKMAGVYASIVEGRGRTVTFLFTDIEGSTRLWEEASDSMGRALARHDALMREAVAAHRGEVFKTVGDAFCIAFDSVPAAVSAALDAQLALTTESWPTPRPLRVRMAVHSGEAESRDGDYFGLPLNRVARLLAVGHGGQTLLSAPAYELARDSLPGGAFLVPLGDHRLKDLTRSEAVYGLRHPALLAEFPPLRSLDNEALPNNLPEQTTSFVGREAELRHLWTNLKRHRLLTLVGPGGTGKTRLGLQAAADSLDAFDGGVWLVELAAIEDPSLVAATVAGVLGVAEEPGKPLMQGLAEHLRKAPALLLLDNCEHLLNAAARLADTLLKSAPALRILATSREPLGISGETVYRVPTLSLPKRGASYTVESLSHFEAVRLFVERAVSHRGDFAVTNENAPALASLCLRLDGIPLAIELAAARARSMTVEQIEARLDDRFRLLTGGSRTALPRQQTLRALVEWSHDLLNEAEAAAFRRIAVFAGGWTLEAAEAIVATEGIEEWEVLDLLTSLVDKSLVGAEETDGTIRYRILETVRHYAQERLRESGEEASMVARHAAHFAAFPERLGFQDGAGSGDAMRQMAAEIDNLRAACERGSTEERLRLAFSLRWFWDAKGLTSEGLERGVAALEAAPDAPDGLRLGALIGAGFSALYLGEFGLCRTLGEEALLLARRLSDERQIARVTNNLGIVDYYLGDFPTAREMFQTSFQYSGHPSTFLNLATIALAGGDFAEAERLIEASLATDLPRRMRFSYRFRAKLELARGNAEEAERWATLALESAVQQESAPDRLEAEATLAACLRFRGGDAEALLLLEAILDSPALDYETRSEVLLEGCRCAFALGRREKAAQAVRSYFGTPYLYARAAGLEEAAMLLASDHPREAAVLVGAAAGQRKRQGIVILPFEKGRLERLHSGLRGVLGEDYEIALSEGQAMGLDAATAYAVAGLG